MISLPCVPVVSISSSSDLAKLVKAVWSLCSFYLYIRHLLLAVEQVLAADEDIEVDVIVPKRLFFTKNVFDADSVVSMETIIVI